jgi:hypothetical protein
MDEITAGKGQTETFRHGQEVSGARKSGMEIPSRYGARIVGKNAVPSCGDPNQCQEKEGDCRSKHAAFHRASIMFIGGAPSVRQRLSPRDQIRRLPPSDAD